MPAKPSKPAAKKTPTARKRPSQPVTLVDAVKAKDRAVELDVLADAIAAAIAVCDPEKVAPLFARLESVLAARQDVTVPEVSTSDDLRLARERRREAKPSSSAKQNGGQRRTRGDRSR